MRAVEKISSTSAASTIDPMRSSTSGRRGTFAASPEDRSSSTMTRLPSAARAPTRWPPMAPAPPVTRIVRPDSSGMRTCTFDLRHIRDDPRLSHESVMACDDAEVPTDRPEYPHPRSAFLQVVAQNERHFPHPIAGETAQLDQHVGHPRETLAADEIAAVHREAAFQQFHAIAAIERGVVLDAVDGNRMAQKPGDAEAEDVPHEGRLDHAAARREARGDDQIAAAL